ncbi:agmatinase [Zongyangia sp. HA2173]|uniref:agmatinase n=1 Tax=Zongyangia sp. HA2173 TaxID=3133035 RepID=UPI003164F1E3
MWNKNIETFLGCDATFEEADTVLFGAPYDCTTSYRPGTRFASHTMRGESYGIETYSPYQDKDLTDYAIFDGGDLELPFGDPIPALRMIEEATGKILDAGKRPLMIGGEHLCTLGAARATVKRYPDLYFLHFDAHADLREDYLGQRLSHATVLRRVWDLVGDHRIFQYGIRSGDREEFYWGRDHVFTHKFDLRGIEETVKCLEGKPVYFTLDLDVLDPSVFPGTGTPEAGGVTFPELMEAMAQLSRLSIVACDVNELCPPLDPSGISTAMACKVLRELLLYLH